MTAENPLIKKLLDLPQDSLLSPGQLVGLGIGSHCRLHHWRLNGHGPKYLRLPEKTYLYAPTDVVSWLRECQNSSLALGVRE